MPGARQGVLLITIDECEISAQYTVPSSGRYFILLVPQYTPALLSTALHLYRHRPVLPPLSFLFLCACFLFHYDIDPRLEIDLSSAYLVRARHIQGTPQHVVMPTATPLDRESRTLPTIDPRIHPWLRSVVALGFLSCISVFILLLVLIFKLIQWQIKSKRTNQFVILIFNLLWADMQQSLAFLLNVEWLRVNSVVVESPICFAQGWLVSTGDLGSGVWCFAIGLHTFASVIFNYRLQPRAFFLTIIALWVFIIGVSCIPLGLKGSGVYVRSGIWVG